MNRRLLLGVLALGALALPAAAHADPVAAPGAATEVRAYAGTIVFSQYQPATATQEAGYRLAIRRRGAAPELLPVAASARTFDADIGPDSNGDPELIYQRCDETCDLFVYSLGGAGGERPVRNANDPDHNDVQPTLWRGRIAWARIYGEQRDRKVIVYTKALTAPRSRPSTRLPGVPEHRCGDVAGSCGPTTGRSVDALELWGDHLAEVVGYTCTGCSGIGQSELRLVRVSTARPTHVAFQVVGLSGQSLVGPSFAGGFLGWYKACLGDPAGCGNGKAGPMRYGLQSGTYAKAPAGPVRVDGYADTGATLYEVAGCSVEPDPQFNTACRIEELAAPGYAPVAAPLGR